MALIATPVAAQSLSPGQTPSKPVESRLAGATDQEVARYFDDYIASTIKRLNLPGGAVVVVRAGRPILRRGFGVADFESRKPITAHDSLFRLASVSKLFAWFAVMQLVEEGRIDLDRDLNSYLDFQIPPAFADRSRCVT